MNKWKPKPFERTSIFPSWPFGLDSVQGYLELAAWYAQGDVIFHCNARDETTFHSMYYCLSRLEKEGYLDLDWAPRTSSSGEDVLELNQIALTTLGRELLSELQARSRSGKLKANLTTIVWAVATSVATTLATLALTGEV